MNDFKNNEKKISINYEENLTVSTTASLCTGNRKDSKINSVLIDKQYKVRNTLVTDLRKNSFNAVIDKSKDNNKPKRASIGYVDPSDNFYQNKNFDKNKPITYEGVKERIIYNGLGSNGINNNTKTKTNDIKLPPKNIVKNNNYSPNKKKSSIINKEENNITLTTPKKNSFQKPKKDGIFFSNINLLLR